MSKDQQPKKAAQSSRIDPQKAKALGIPEDTKVVRMGSREFAELVKSGHFKSPLEMSFGGHHVATLVPKDDKENE